MSEHQYYEFVAVDRPLSRDEMSALRKVSSRATITPTRFVNEYNWGDLHADPNEWMRRYFDAYIYTANWRTCQLSLRLPHDAFTEAELHAYMTDGALTVGRTDTHWIINWLLEDGANDERFAVEDGDGWMADLLPLREELLSGDCRSLYLGWLAGVASYDIDDDAIEPAVPPGMSELSPAQLALAGFLEIDPDLLAAAAQGSPAPGSADDDDSAEAWIAGLSRNEMRPVFNLLLRGDAALAERRVKSAFRAWQKDSGTVELPQPGHRSAGQLRLAAAEIFKLRETREADARAQAEALQRQQRDAHLRTLAADVQRSWNTIRPHAEAGTASAYQVATRKIADLADAYALGRSMEEFQQDFRRFMAPYMKRAALLRQLVGAGLWKK